MHAQVHPSSQRTLRAVLTVAVITLALTLRDALDLVESVAGGVCIVATCVFLPAAFYAALLRKHGRMRLRHAAAIAAVCCFGGVLTAAVLCRTAIVLAAWLQGSGGGVVSVAAGAHGGLSAEAAAVTGRASAPW